MRASNTPSAGPPMQTPLYACKPDWDKAQTRWDAFWALAPTDRPCMAMRAPRPDPPAIELPVLQSREQKWMDPEYVVTVALNRMAKSHLCGEATPSCGGFMALSATGCNGRRPRANSVCARSRLAISACVWT